MFPILPPTLRRLLGRPTKVRRKEPDEPQTIERLSKRGVDIRYSKCKRIGHNKRSYKEEVSQNIPVKRHKVGVPTQQQATPNQSAPGILVFDLEIEKTVRANRKETKLQKKQSGVVGTQSNLPPEIEVDDEVESRVNENPTQTLESKKVEIDSPEEVLNARVDENPNLADRMIRDK
ncbi:hypothetical protein PVK06_016606 [Gossypium arboreum]|uniref:Uncharacterized protein n=1 Tax=Gossypium arboreum TaxID=29729 RepID=A0ABR0Q1E4_GOSAR|nr:hypothetical protein PVK06_016606 [Gossypium arboreum]